MTWSTSACNTPATARTAEHHSPQPGRAARPAASPALPGPAGDPDPACEPAPPADLAGPRPPTPQALEMLRHAIIGKAVDLVSGPGGLAQLPAHPARRSPAGRAQPAAGRRALRRDPRRDPPRGHPAGPALPLGRRLRPARLRLRSAPRDPPGRRRQDQRGRLRAVLLLSPSCGDSSVGLDRRPASRRHHHRPQPRRHQNPQKPRTTGVTPGPEPRRTALWSRYRPKRMVGW